MRFPCLFLICSPEFFPAFARRLQLNHLLIPLDSVRGPCTDSLPNPRALSPGLHWRDSILPLVVLEFATSRHIICLF